MEKAGHGQETKCRGGDVDANPTFRVVPPLSDLVPRNILPSNETFHHLGIMPPAGS